MGVMSGHIVFVRSDYASSAPSYRRKIMNSKWLPLRAVAGFAAVLVSQALAPASADAHDDRVRRHRNDARNHRTTSRRNTTTRIITTRGRDLPVHTGAWHVDQANASNSQYARGNSGYQHNQSGQWNNNRTNHNDNTGQRNNTGQHNNTDHRDNANHRNNTDHRDNADHRDHTDHH